MIDQTDFAYAAGYFDGDGCFSLGKYREGKRIKYSPKAIINTTELENVQWFQTKFGGNILQSRSRPTHKSIHRYVLRGDSLDLFKEIERFLVEKLAESKVFEDFRNSDSREEKERLILEMTRLKTESNLIQCCMRNELKSISNTIKPSLEDFAYLAGFVDAECCLSIARDKGKNRTNYSYKMFLGCNNTKSPCFTWLARRFGGQFTFINRSKNPNWRNQMSWRISAASLYPLLEKIHPFLKHKKPVCEQMIKFHELTLKTGHVSPNSTLFEEFYRPIREARESIFHKIHFLNKKGI